MSVSGKDVKSSAPVLSSQVRQSAAPPKPRVGRKVRIVEDYVSIDGDAVSPPTSPLASGSASGGVCTGATFRTGSDSKGAVGSGARSAACKAGPDSPTSSEKSDGAGAGTERDGERVEPVVSAAADKALALMSRRKHPDITDYKHFYQLVNPAPPAFGTSGTERYLPLCAIAGGIGLNNRLTNKIRVHRSIIRLWVAIQPLSVSTQAPVWPTITMMVFREKVPAVLGTPILMYATGANPPINTNTIMDRLGQVQSVANDEVAIRAPVNSDKYVMHLMRKINLREVLGHLTPSPAGALQNAWNTPFSAKTFEFDIPWSGTEVQYNEQSQVSATINALWVNLRIDYAGGANDTANGFRTDYVMTTDTEFTDVQDDAI